MNLNFPVFHGGNDNPVDWLSLAELYFKYLKAPEEKKVEIASLHRGMRFHDFRLVRALPQLGFMVAVCGEIFEVLWAWRVHRYRDCGEQP
ncbi:unnamed protein product [Prunus armeniaca]|uniref:Uncharacterized protein n=1 Tax=Prunus armeniaca TaxID=36596 RepID=A0A6J5U7P2_PRUAR|nr:unnamed protein product [Prunus armeniaca]